VVIFLLKNLKAEMIRNGVTGGQMAEAIKIHPATLSAKISEKRVMTWNEVNAIRNAFFPNCALEYLFASDGKAERSGK